ncbi:MAG: hypothetical protein P8Y02_04295 [Deinococcales bacterium]
MASGPIQTRFFELAGGAAQARLTDLAAHLRRGGTRATLLQSREEPDLYLLVVEAEQLPELAVPEGCRVWTFQRVDV